MTTRFFNILRWKQDPGAEDILARSVLSQLQSWKKANRKMGWGITSEEFDEIRSISGVKGKSCDRGFGCFALSYGFGDDGHGNSDSVLSGKMAWEYACRNRWRKTWQCRYIDFDKPDHVRLRPGAPTRPRGFYFTLVGSADQYRNMTVSRARKTFQGETGLGPEGVQLLAITHTHLQDMMNERKIAFMVLADYDVAPYGFNDFFDAVQVFCSLEILGLGIGNVDRRYPLFGIPQMRLFPKTRVNRVALFPPLTMQPD